MTTTAPALRRRHGGIHRGEAASGWLFTAPMIVLLGLFLVIPVLMALWVSFSDWNGNGSPFASGVSFVGTDNYHAILAGGGLAEQDFGTALRNNAWYVVLVVPLQTALSLYLAVLVDRRMLRGRGFFRTAFYFPSVTSSVAITVLWLFLFSASGAVNQVLSWFGVHGPNWFSDPSGVIHDALQPLGVDQGPAALTQHGFLGVSWWDWIGGPSVAMTAFILMAIFTTSGTFMLVFLAALQNLSSEVTEAAMVDGANGWQRFWRITLPQLRPTLFTVLTLGLIGGWQIFDQIYTGTQGGPAKTTLSPAYLSYQTAFTNQQWGQGAAIAFILFVIIVAFTLLQRWVLRERGVPRRKRFGPVTPGPATPGATPAAPATASEVTP
ncbi:sugar ABC transporter permease [Luteimicrobium album]|uniref:Sugar ABC transporter permease n=1 Tax=Luteimicrobium album TaxID=1054550 RepID=A0ABQ6HY86_9MICO|nr:sugar ABC transporter permease [Luteimicrobium album]GMA23092.1 sugar ABC transporter permease [Luteimicrobium album]